MPQVQFNALKVLFKGGKADFCPADCVCEDPVDPPPSPTPPNSCTNCASPHKSIFDLDCTPRTLRLTFAGTAARTTCIACGTGGSIKVTSGSLTGVYDLQQTLGNSSVWTFEDPSPTMVATGYIGAACTSTATVSTHLLISATRDAAGLDIQALLRIFANGTFADFIVFSGRYSIASPTNLPSTFSVTATDATDLSNCFGWQQGMGGRLGWAGSVGVVLCPIYPHFCTCHDAYTCLTVSPIILPIGIADFVYPACSGDDETPPPTACTTTKVEVPYDHTCEWLTGTVSAGGVNNLKVKIHWYNEGDVHAVNGCGYYLYLYAVTGGGDVEKAHYYLDAIEPVGKYVLVDTEIEDMPQFLIVANDCVVVPPDAPALCPAVVPSAIMMTGWEAIGWEPDVAIDYGGTFPLWDGVLVTDTDLPCRWISAYHSTVVDVSSRLILWQAIVSLELGVRWVLIVQQQQFAGGVEVWIGYKTTGLGPSGVYTRDPAAIPNYTSDFHSLTPETLEIL